jgi:hypothetical protein
MWIMTRAQPWVSKPIFTRGGTDCRPLVCSHWRPLATADCRCGASRERQRVISPAPRAPTVGRGKPFEMKKIVRPKVGAILLSDLRALCVSEIRLETQRARRSLRVIPRQKPFPALLYRNQLHRPQSFRLRIRHSSFVIFLPLPLSTQLISSTNFQTYCSFPQPVIPSKVVFQLGGVAEDFR